MSDALNKYQAMWVNILGNCQHYLKNRFLLLIFSPIKIICLLIPTILEMKKY